MFKCERALYGGRGANERSFARDCLWHGWLLAAKTT